MKFNQTNRISFFCFDFSNMYPQATNNKDESFEIWHTLDIIITYVWNQKNLII